MKKNLFLVILFFAFALVACGEKADPTISVDKDDVSIELAQIEAWKQIGVAYGKNQKSDHYNITWLVR